MTKKTPLNTPPSTPRKPTELLIMQPKNKRTIWIVFISLFLLAWLGQIGMFSLKYARMSDGIKKGEVSIITNVQNKWTIDGKGNSYWGSKQFHITENNYATDNDLIDKLQMSIKEKDYRITDNSNTLFFATRMYLDVPKTTVSKLLGFADNKKYDVHQVLVESKALIILIFSMVALITQLVQSIVIIGFITLAGRVFAKIRKSGATFSSSFYVTLHSFAYGLMVNFLVGLFIEIPINLAVIFTIITLYLFVEGERGKTLPTSTPQEKTPKKTKAEKKAEKKAKKKAKLAATELPKTREPQPTLPPTNTETTSLETEELPKDAVSEMLTQATEMQGAIKQHNVLYADEPVEVEELASLYAAYQNQQEQENKDSLEEVNQAYNYLAQSSRAEKQLEEELTQFNEDLASLPTQADDSER